ncbi:4-hydroxy-tetrahydrodipicolinate synthase 2-chloroplastic [Striga hermonthica]|uniref:4-hydroxy-tetrahydrodipicolinate synthase n=1 Tax=Striga hermonthica TaxID=68872 RepID=A0A9N7NE80_STRHE|nr:4-hydroxy-tetrahydrodipicolinate synthase 2-chloroplastic [Striga hermonthica]
MARTNVDEIKDMRLITAIKTPYLPDGRFDFEAYDALVIMQIEGGAEGVIVGGTTDERHLMSLEEHIVLIAHTVNCFGGCIKVVGNTGSSYSIDAIHATEQGFAVGMHAALHINPYYRKTSLDDMTLHLESVLHMGPTIVQNVRSRKGPDISLSVIRALAQSPNLAGVMECFGHARVEEHVASGLVVWSGKDNECHDSRWDHGGRGVISVVSNLIPGLMREMMFGRRNPELNARIFPLVKWLFEESHSDSIGLNTAMAQLGVVRPVFQYYPRDLDKRVKFVKIVEVLGRENFIGDKEVRVLDDDDFVLID